MYDINLTQAREDIFMKKRKAPGWYEFECISCQRVLSKKKSINYRQSGDCYKKNIFLCRSCASIGCSLCRESFSDEDGIFALDENIYCLNCRPINSRRLGMTLDDLTYRGEDRFQCVYLMYSKKLETWKIGESTNLKQRLKDVSNGTMSPLKSKDWEIIYFFPLDEPYCHGASAKKRKTLESMLHLVFNKYHSCCIDYFKFPNKNIIINIFMQETTRLYSCLMAIEIEK